MNSALFVLALLATVANGRVAPAPTPAARLLEARQASEIYTIWSPTLSPGALSFYYTPFSWQEGDTSLTVTSSGDYWAWCWTNVNCNTLYTGCTSSTLYGPDGIELACSTSSLCGTEYLYSSTGAPERYTRPVCWYDNAVGSSYSFKQSFYIASPAAVSATSTSSSSSSTSSSTSSLTPTSTSSSTTTPQPTSTPTPPPKSSPPIGAIVGGAIGGLVIVALTIIGVVFLIRRNRGSPNNNNNNNGPGASGNVEENAAPTNQEVLQPQQHPFLVEQGQKGGVATSGSPIASSPPPQYQSHMMQGSAETPELGSHSVMYGGATELPVTRYR